MSDGDERAPDATSDGDRTDLHPATAALLNTVFPRADDGDGDDTGTGSTDGADVDWPVDLRGVTESVVATLGPNDRWNVAALGLHAPDEPGAPVTARTFGRTRTWRNFTERGGGVVQFTSDPREFVDAALTVREEPGPVLPNADAWVAVRAEAVAAADRGDITVRTWELRPVAAAVRTERVPTINRAFGAVVDATVAASRLDVPAYDTGELLDRLRYFADVVDRCGGPAEREAFARVDEATGWRGLDDERGGDERGASERGGDERDDDDAR